MVPAKYEVTDVGSGKKYTTYSTWGKENMLGYNFYDVESGERVMLKGYTTRTLAPGGYLKPKSAEVAAYRADKARAGIKGVQ